MRPPECPQFVPTVTSLVVHVLIMPALMFLRWWLLFASLARCREIDTGDCPRARAAKAEPQTSGVMLMQKGIVKTKMKIEQPDEEDDGELYVEPYTEPGVLETGAAVQIDPAMRTWAESVLDATSRAAEAYAGQQNRSFFTDSIPEGKHYSFLTKHWSLLVAVCILLLVVAIICIFDIEWMKKQKAQEHDSNLAARTESFSLDLVRHLLPSAKIDRHQFRGLSRKSSSITLGFKDLGLEIPGHGKVLSGVSGEFKAGRMTIILGPSGAGKTTFMNVLCGKAHYGTPFGKVLVNGVETQLADFKSVIGFVPQDDVVHEKLTVREQIHFSALMRNENGTDAATLCHIVDDVLAVLQIEHIQRSIVGSVAKRGISGGQRKRVNIGLELAAFPTLLFLDEPTSGLDSTSSLALVKSLKKMTQLGMTIVVVAHQPRWSLFTLFDDVHIMAKGGHTAYLGPVPEACPYFESLGFKKPGDENLADWLMDIVSGTVPNSAPQFTSSMLVTSWAEHDSKGSNVKKRSYGTQATRLWTAHDDRAVLAHALEEEWARVDKARSGSITIAELASLLENTAGEHPSDEVAKELASQIAGPNATAVLKTQFVDYFVALEQVVTTSAKPYIDTSFDPSTSARELLTSHDLHRVKPGFLSQFSWLICRRIVQIRRMNRERGIDVCTIVIIAAFLGWLNRGQMSFRDPFLASKILVLHLGLCLLITVSCLRTFGVDRLVWWRECSSGLNLPAFFCARMVIDTLDIFLQCLLYTALYYLLAQPDIPFSVHFLPCLYLSIAASGWGYLISVVFPPENTALVAILFMLVTSGFLGDPGAAHGWFSLLSITRWSSQMTYLGTADVQGSFLQGQFPHWIRDEIKGIVMKSPPDPFDVFKACGFMSSSMIEAGYRTSSVNNWLGHWYSASLVLLIMAVVLRVLAFGSMCFLNRGKFA